jgi:hypothetical protein
MWSPLPQRICPGGPAFRWSRYKADNCSGLFQPHLTKELHRQSVPYHAPQAATSRNQSERRPSALRILALTNIRWFSVTAKGTATVSVDVGGVTESPSIASAKRQGPLKNSIDAFWGVPISTIKAPPSSSHHVRVSSKVSVNSWLASEAATEKLASSDPQQWQIGPRSS